MLTLDDSLAKGVTFYVSKRQKFTLWGMAAEGKQKNGGITLNIIDRYLHTTEEIEKNETYALLFEMSYIAMQDEAREAFSSKLLDHFLINGSLMLLHKNNEDFVTVTYSAQTIGGIQRTIFKKRVPVSHKDFTSIQECIQSDVLDWLLDYQIVSTIQH